MNQDSTIVADFDDRPPADRAVDELRRAGFRDDQIGVATRYDSGTGTGTATDTGTDTGIATGATAAETTDAGKSEAGIGAIAGVLGGLVVGALAGLGVISGIIPVVGPAVASGTLGIIVSNAALGAGVGGLVGGLVGCGIPECEARYYHTELDAGQTIVTVRSDGRADEAMAILRHHGACDTIGRPVCCGTANTADSTTECTTP